MNVTWTELKSFATRNSAGIQYIEQSDGYLVFVCHSGMTLASKLIAESAELGDFETSYKSTANQTIVPYRYAFASKKIGQFGLFKRLTGLSVSVPAESSAVLSYTIPFNKCKLDGVDVLWASERVTADFKVLDTATGTLSGVPNYILNQFAFGAVIAKDFHQEKAQYDADLIKDLVLQFTFHNATLVPQTLGVNLHLHEVKA